ncbi:hypothetical protein CSUI_000796, partial [Cystoisospora suis]
MLISLLTRRGLWRSRRTLLLFFGSRNIYGTSCFFVHDVCWLRGITEVAEVLVRVCGCDESELELRLRCGHFMLGRPFLLCVADQLEDGIRD